MNRLADWYFITSLIPAMIPAIFALAALQLPRRAGAASGSALALALLFTVAVAVLPRGPTPGGPSFVRVDAVTC